jgi:hypothetical protein
MAGFIAQDRCATPAELVTITTPFTYASGPYKGQRIRCTVHKSLERRTTIAMRRAARYSDFGRKDKVERIDSFVCRAIRGATSLSNHGKGAALDIFATGPTVPPPGGVWEPDTTYGKNFARCFTDLGFTWGRQWDRRDDPHLEWSSNHVPPLTLEERIRTRRLARKRWNESKAA